MFQVTIMLDQATATALLKSGYRLYAFKAVRNSDLAGQVLVWFGSDLIGPRFVIAWNAAYAAYVTRSQQDPPEIDATFPIASGQTLSITDPLGTGSVLRTGQPGAITIQNNSDVPFRAGIAQDIGGGPVPQPLNAFPLYGNSVQVITPVERILLAFSTRAWQPGQAVDSLAAPSPASNAQHAGTGALLVDMDGAGEMGRSVAFDINRGWDWGAANWGQSIPVTASLAAVLILPDA